MMNVEMSRRNAEWNYRRDRKYLEDTRVTLFYNNRGQAGSIDFKKFYETIRNNPGKALVGATIIGLVIFSGCITPQGKLSITADREGPVNAGFDCEFTDSSGSSAKLEGTTPLKADNAFEEKSYDCRAEYEEAKVREKGKIGKGDYTIAFLFPEKDLITGGMLPLKQGCPVKVRVLVGDKEAKTELKYGAVDGGERIPVDAPATLYLGERYPLFIIASSCLDENGVNPTIPNHEIPDYKVTCDPVKDNLVLKAKECVVPVTDGPSVPPVNPMTGQTVGQTPSTGTTPTGDGCLIMHFSGSQGLDYAPHTAKAIEKVIADGAKAEDCEKATTDGINLRDASVARYCIGVAAAHNNPGNELAAMRANCQLTYGVVDPGCISTMSVVYYWTGGDKQIAEQGCKEAGQDTVLGEDMTARCMPCLTEEARAKAEEDGVKNA